MNVYVLTFESTHAAMASSKKLTSEGYAYWTIPTPREISAGCGITLRFQEESPDDVVACLFGESRDTGTAALYEQVDSVTYQRVLDL